MKIGAMYVDKHPVTNAQYSSYLTKSRYHPKDSANWLKQSFEKGKVKPGWEQRPVTYVSVQDARHYCAAVGKRLPQAYEFQYFAQGTDRRIFPWGEFEDSKRTPVLHGNHTNLGPEPVGNYPGGASVFGVEDLVSSVWQITSAFEDTHTAAVILRGGSNYAPHRNPHTGQGVWYFRPTPRLDTFGKLMTMGPSYDRAGTVSFRCVADAVDTGLAYTPPTKPVCADTRLCLKSISDMCPLGAAMAVCKTDLSQAGVVDWAHWGSVNASLRGPPWSQALGEWNTQRKAAGKGLLVPRLRMPGCGTDECDKNETDLRTWPSQPGWPSNRAVFTWHGGAPAAVAPNTARAGVFSTRGRFEMTVITPSAGPHQLTLYLGVFNWRGDLPFVKQALLRVSSPGQSTILQNVTHLDGNNNDIKNVAATIVFKAQVTVSFELPNPDTFCSNAHQLGSLCSFVAWQAATLEEYHDSVQPESMKTDDVQVQDLQLPTTVTFSSSSAMKTDDTESTGSSTAPLVSPDYVGVGGNVSFGDALAILALAGLANRDTPTLWLNTSATPLFPSGPRPPYYPGGVSVNVWYPGADAVWRDYLAKSKGLGEFDVAADSQLCTLLGDARMRSVPKGLVMYEESDELNGLQYAAITAAGLHDGLPVTLDMVTRHSCLQAMPTVFKLPVASSFEVDLDVYRWAIKELLPISNKKVVVSACHSWKNYSCGWTLAPGIVTLDYAVSVKAFVMNLSPDEKKYPEQGVMTQTILKHLDTGGLMLGWSEPETVTVRYLAISNSVIICGAPNLSFLASVKPGRTRALPHHRTPTAEDPAPLDRSVIYLTFMSNEGDTAKDAFALNTGNWRGKVPMSWGMEPILGELFPALHDFYIDTATGNDQWFSACGGGGYTYPWLLPDPEQYFLSASELASKYMPPKDLWVVVWGSSHCPQPNDSSCVGEQCDPCKGMYTRFRNTSLTVAGGHVGGFSQRQTFDSSRPQYTQNIWLDDGTPVFSEPVTMWYPQHGPCPANLTLSDQCDCMEAQLKLVAANNMQRPLFLPIYGAAMYVDVALCISQRLPKSDWAVVGAQDFAALGRESAPKAAARNISSVVSGALKADDGEAAEPLFKFEPNMADFLAQSDMLFDFSRNTSANSWASAERNNTLPTNWLEGPSLGNGLLGSVTYFCNPPPSIPGESPGQASWEHGRGAYCEPGNATTMAELRLELGRQDLYSARQPVTNFWNSVRLPVGYLQVKTAGKLQSGAMRVSLWNAEVTGNMTTDKGSLGYHHFVHATAPVHMMELLPSDGEAVSIRFVPLSKCVDRPDVLGLINCTLHPSPVPTCSGDPEAAGGLSCHHKMGYNGTILTDQGSFATHVRVVRSGDRRVTVLMSTESAMWPHDIKSDPIAAASAVVSSYAMNMVAMERSHKEWWHGWWPSSFLSIPDAPALSFYWLQMFQIGLGMREDGPVRDEIGPSYVDTEWPTLCKKTSIPSLNLA
jgi:hypothetical protein